MLRQEPRLKRSTLGCLGSELIPLLSPVYFEPSAVIVQQVEVEMLFRCHVHLSTRRDSMERQTCLAIISASEIV
jgi:hypothetical protein